MIVAITLSWVIHHTVFKKNQVPYGYCIFSPILVMWLCFYYVYSNRKCHKRSVDDVLYNWGWTWLVITIVAALISSPIQLSIYLRSDWPGHGGGEQGGGGESGGGGDGGQEASRTDP